MASLMTFFSFFSFFLLFWESFYLIKTKQTKAFLWEKSGFIQSFIPNHPKPL